MATNFIKLRGLPFAATEIDILTFLEGLPVWNEQSVIITINNEGRPSGEAVIKLEQMVNVNDLRAYNGRYMGNRFIEVFPSSQGEYFCQENIHKTSDMTLVRMRGLPYDTTKEDIYIFFARLMISHDGVGLLIGPDDVPTGEAFVQFVSRDDANLALQRHNQCIRSRYIEVYKSSFTEATRAMEKQYEINREEVLNRGRNMQQNYPPNFNNGPGGAPYPIPSGNCYQDPAGAYGGPIRRIRDTSKFKTSPYGDKPTGPGAMNQNHHEFSNPNQTTILMRGLPYSATEQDVRDFFCPLQLAGVNIFRGNDGKLTGEAEANFLSHEDAVLGMQKDRCKMSWRYIELFATAP